MLSIFQLLPSLISVRLAGLLLGGGGPGGGLFGGGPGGGDPSGGGGHIMSSDTMASFCPLGTLEIVHALVPCKDSSN